MKKLLALFLTVVLVGTMLAAFATASAAEDSIDGFVFDIAAVDDKITAEKGLLLTSETALANSSTGWTVLIHLEKVEGDLYKAKADAIVPTGTIPTLTFASGDVVIGIHSSTSDMAQVSTYPNCPQKLAALKVKTGNFITLSGIDLTAKTATNAKATVSLTDPRSSSAKETITVDGKLDDNGWKSTGWTHASSANGKWQTPLDEGVTRNENFDFQFRADGSNLYFAIKYNSKPLGKAENDCFGNGKGTNIRLWTFVDGAKYENVAYTTYNSFINIAYKDGEVITTPYQNTTPTANKAAVVTFDGLNVKATSSDSYWYVEGSVPFAALGATTKASFFITVSTPTDYEVKDGKLTQVGNNALFYPAFTAGPEGGSYLANAPYTLWDKNTDIDLVFADIALSNAGEETSEPTVPDYVDITGDKVADPSFTLDMTAPANYKPGDTINVVITLNNIKVTNGIELVMFKLYYDATRVEPVVKNDTTTDNDQMNGFITKAPNKDKWECFGKLEEDQSRYDLSFLTGQLANVVKADGDLVITVPFKVKADVKGSIAFQMPHKDTEADDHDTNKYYGNAGLVVLNLGSTETSSETSSDTSSTTSTSSSTSSTNSDVKTGDTGTIAVVMVAILALAGVTAVAVKKRSR